MNKKIIAGIAALLMCVSMTACKSDNNAAPETTPETTASAASEETVTEADLTPTEPVDLEAGLTDKMYQRALLNEGNRSRLAAAMKKAENGEPVTVGVIGGSITQGSSATNPANSYAGLFSQYWTEKFPSSEITYVNAGIGGTNSYLGVHRADEQLLSAKPDVVIVEFSVNDTDKVMNKYSYDSLVRKILNAEGDPAVILLFTTQENGTSLQDVHKEIGLAYDLPMLSYREVVYPEVAAGTLSWKDISPDNIHPNDAGHSLIGQLLARYLDSVYDDLANIDDTDTAFTADPYTADYYKNATMLGASQAEVSEMSGFEISGNKVYPELFPDNFVTEGEGYLKFEIECQNLGIFYLKQTDGKGGKYDVLVDGERKTVLDADFSGGWGNYGEPQQVIIGKETGKHTIEIKLSEGSDKTALTIFGIMVS
ncbi:MAG: SGNH/GDSL hydrolase family protein [Oscillospiraceae bacterium]|nr:SGNH/GDSL hydrolase family protein [Oscillospiraceae bacterium]MDY6207424.1 SGNH/GDSL hydrolase family protein [Oscillospiraceae bacterium]